MTRHWKRPVILLVAYAGAVGAAFGGWFGARPFEKTMPDAGLALRGVLPEHHRARIWFSNAVGLGVVFRVVIWRLVPADPSPERK